MVTAKAIHDHRRKTIGDVARVVEAGSDAASQNGHMSDRTEVEIPLCRIVDSKVACRCCRLAVVVAHVELRG